MRRVIASTCVSLCACLWLFGAAMAMEPGAAQAQRAPDGVAQLYAEQQAEAVARLNKLAAELQAQPEAQWRNGDVQDYLDSALWTVFAGMQLFERAEGRNAASLNELVDGGYLPSVPLNPFAGWQPMALAVDDLSFAPGRLCLQRCPAEEADPLRDRGYELSVFGPRLNFPPCEIRMARHNAEWAVMPAGTCAQLGVSHVRAGE